MANGGLRLLVKTNRAATAATVSFGAAPVAITLTPLMPSIDRPAAGAVAAVAPAAWYIAEAQTSLNPWDACHALLTQGLGMAAGDVVLAEPDLQQNWLWTTPNRQALGIAGACEVVPANGDVYAIGDTNLWFADETHSQLAKMR